MAETETAAAAPSDVGQPPPADAAPWRPRHGQPVLFRYGADVPGAHRAPDGRYFGAYQRAQSRAGGSYVVDGKAAHFPAVETPDLVLFVDEHGHCVEVIDRSSGQARLANAFALPGEVEGLEPCLDPRLMPPEYMRRSGLDPETLVLRP